MEPAVRTPYSDDVIKMLNDSNTNFRERAVDITRTLELMEARAPYVDATAKMLDDSAESVRHAVFEFLYALEPAMRVPYVDAIAAKITDPFPLVRTEKVIRMLGRLEPVALAAHVSAIG